MQTPYIDYIEQLTDDLVAQTAVPTGVFGAAALTWARCPPAVEGIMPCRSTKQQAYARSPLCVGQDGLAHGRFLCDLACGRGGQNVPMPVACAPPHHLVAFGRGSCIECWTSTQTVAPALRSVVAASAASPCKGRSHHSVRRFE